MKDNNWYVITGAPHSGKTSVIELLKKKGYKVVYETARVYIDQELAKGHTLEEIRGDELRFQKGILDKKSEIEKKLDSEEVIFFDRAIPDTGAYYELCGFNKDKRYRELSKKCVYKKVFLFELLPYKKDYARTETEKEQVMLQELLEEEYRKLGNVIVVVPTMNSPEERMKFVLNNM
jgi:predicted ATPase